MTWEVTTALLLAAGAFITALVGMMRLKVDTGKTQADIRHDDAKINIEVARAASELVDDLRQEIERLQKKVDILEDKLSRQHLEILNLTSQFQQSRERITALETENEMLGNENEQLRGNNGCDKAQS